MRTLLLLMAGAVIFLSSSSFMQKEAKDERSGGKVTVVFTQEVKDYSAWRKVYDEKTRGRRTPLVKVTGIYTDTDNPNMVTIIAVVRNAALVDSITSDAQFKSALDDAGVVGTPDVKVLKPVPAE